MSTPKRIVSSTIASVRSAWILLSSGVVDVTRPDRMMLAYYDIRTLGPIVTPVRLGARRHPDRIAVIDDRGQVSYRQLDDTSDRLAAALRDAGHGDNSVIGTLCRDHIGLVQAMVAAGKLGARLVLLNTSMSARQTADVCAREGVTLVLHDEEFHAELAHVTAGRFTVRGSAGDVESLIASMPTGTRCRRPRRAGSLVSLTGGTTGLPKGARRSVSSPLAAAQFLERIPLPAGGTTLYAAPMFHGTGLSQFLLSLSLGSTNILQPRFDALNCLQIIDRHEVATVVLVPTMLHRILGLGEQTLADYDTRSLQIIFSAGSAVPISVGDAAIAAFGPVLYNLYGSSEVGVVSVAMPADWIAAPGTAGKPPSPVTVRLYDEGGRVVTEPGCIGTIYAGSALSFDGYTDGSGKETRDGLLSSGDVGHWDAAGRLFVDGRDDDMIVSGGENVYPGEVEDLLYAHPQIVEAAVHAVADDDFGQRLAAVVVTEPGQTLTADDIRAYVKEHSARYKVPRDVRFADSLPRTASGKLLRRHLIEHS